MKDIDKGVRIANYLIDFALIQILWMGMYLLYPHHHWSLSFYLIMFLFYFGFEISIGQTPGKMLTKTKVVAHNGAKPRLIQIFMRSFWRLIPYDSFSYLMGYEIGLHDSLSATKLAKNVKIKND